MNHSQTYFIPGKHIQYQNLLAYKLIKGYNRNSGAPRCMVHMELQKTYDYVEQSPLETILNEMSFCHKFIRWIMLNITIVLYKYKVNEDHSNILMAKIGLKQGNLSPMLFVLVMDYLHKTLRKLKKNTNFNFQSK